MNLERLALESFEELFSTHERMLPARDLVMRAFQIFIEKIKKEAVQ